MSRAVTVAFIFCISELCPFDCLLCLFCVIYNSLTSDDFIGICIR